jgi:hypothetical protein
MVGRIAAIASLVIVGVIVADILIHPAGTAAASSGIVGVEKPALNALLGATN